MQLTSGQVFHHRWCTALAAQDVATLRGMYHPGAVQVSTATGQVLTGVDQIAGSLTQLFNVAGAVTTTRVEQFVDAGELICVESVQTTTYAQALTYDVFVLEGGLIRFHANGSISPRTQAPPPVPANPPTPGQDLYLRYWAAVGALDPVALSTLYAPNVVQVNVGTVVHGRDAILAAAQQYWHSGGRPQLMAVSRFVEAPQAVCVEAVAKMGGQGSLIDLTYYEVWLIQSGVVSHAVRGLITPRPAELREGLQRLHEHQIRAAQTVTEGMARLITPPSRW